MNLRKQVKHIVGEESPIQNQQAAYSRGPSEAGFVCLKVIIRGINFKMVDNPIISAEVLRAAIPLTG